MQQDKPPPIRVEGPWNTYTALHSLEHGSGVTVACTRTVHVEMVAVKKLFHKLSTLQRENILAIIGASRSKDCLHIITDFTTATLKQVIAAPLPLEKLHVSATCRQAIISLTC